MQPFATPWKHLKTVGFSETKWNKEGKHLDNREQNEERKKEDWKKRDAKWRCEMEVTED